MYNRYLKRYLFEIKENQEVIKTKLLNYSKKYGFPFMTTFAKDDRIWLFSSNDISVETDNGLQNIISIDDPFLIDNWSYGDIW